MRAVQPLLPVLCGAVGWLYIYNCIGVRALQPLLPVLCGAVGLPAVLQDAGQGEPGLQGLPSGK